MGALNVVQRGTGIGIGTRVEIADTWWRRARGLLARPRLQAGQGMLLIDCASVHTAGMRYAIDVAFLDEDGLVVRTVAALAPWRVGLGGPHARHALELPAGRLQETGTVAGIRLHWSAA